MPLADNWIVYKIPSSNCDSNYIREAGRPVQEKIKEQGRDAHLLAYKLNCSVQTYQQDWPLSDWEKIKTTDTETNFR